MKLVLISDSHMQLGKIKIPNGDLLIHAGDLTYRGTVQEIERELKILGQQPHRNKILICGNHDWLGEKQPSLMRELCKENGIIYLHHESIQVDGFNIFGSPYTPEFCNWAFNVPRGQKLKELWNQIPENTNILITHGPPLNILDPVQRIYFDGKTYTEHVGCMELATRITQLPHLKLHVFGHIHDGYGAEIQNGVTFINASICTEAYKPTNKPMEIEL